jgi:hypothetical protein
MILIRAIAGRCAYLQNASLLLAAVLLSSLSSCRNDHSEKHIRTLDSLNGALNQKLYEIKNLDTTVLFKAVSKYREYKQFVEQNISDTITKPEADFLEQFYRTGNNLERFIENRKTILARGSLISSQLNKLISDLRNSISEEELNQYIKQESGGAQLLIKQSLDQQQVFLENLQEFRLSLSGVESLIRSRNSGQMPVVIKDSLPF